eukprot:1707437-Rhodomonas_salina.1
MADKANDTQVRMMAILAGKAQPQPQQFLTEGAAGGHQSGTAATGGFGEGLDSSFESRFEDFGEVETSAPPLIDTNFLIKELWDPEMRADFA